MLFDSHAHYDDEKFDDDRHSLLESMQENNVGGIVNSCSELSDMERIIPLIEKYPFMYATVGIHPHSADTLDDEALERIKAYLEHPKVKAIGEIGLDYYYDFSPRKVQQEAFARQAELAKELKVPIVIHDRDAHKDTMDILRSVDVRDSGGEFHCYAGGVEMAREILGWGMYIAFGGSLTFKNARRPAEVAAYVPLDMMLIETDSPYLTPTPYRGRRNSSLYIHLVAEKIAEIKGIPVEEVERATFENAKKCFNIGE